MKTQNEIAEVSIIYRSKVKASERPRIRCSKDAYDLLIESWDLDTIEHSEEFKMLLLNRANAVLGILTVSKGGLSGTVTDVRIILQAKDSLVREKISIINDWACYCSRHVNVFIFSIWNTAGETAVL